jgi:hypothetical protein
VNDCPTSSTKDTSTDQANETNNIDDLHIIARFCDDTNEIKKRAKSILLSAGEVPHDQRCDYYAIVAIANYFNNVKGIGNLQTVTKRFKKDDKFTESEVNELETEIEQRIKDILAIQREKAQQEQKNAEIQAAQNAVVEQIEDFDISGIDVEQIHLDAFHVNSSSCDDDIAKIVLLSFVGGREITGDGLHLNVNAPPGSGKSIATGSACHALPEADVYSGAMTDRAVLYDPALQPGTIIKTDEAQGRSETLENIIKEAVSSFQAGILYRTVQSVKTDKGHENITIIKRLPPRLTFITSSVDPKGSDQIRSRFLPLAPVERTDNVNALVTQFRLAKRETGIPKLHTNEKVEKSRKVLQHFMRRLFKARIPNATKIIEYSLKGDQRAQEWFENALLYHAVLNYKKRPHSTDETGVIIVDVTKADYDEVSKLPIFRYSAALDKRLSEAEKGRIEQLQPYKGQIVTMQQLADVIFKCSGGRVTQIMKGRPDRDELGLCDNFAITEANIYGDDGIRTNQKGYYIPADLPDIRRIEIGTTAEKPLAEWKPTNATRIRLGKPAVKSHPKDPETQKNPPENPDFLKECGLE